MFIISWVWRNLKYWVCVFGSSHNKRQLSRIRKYACQQMSSNLRLFWFIDKHFFASKLVIHTFYQQNVGRQTVQTKILGVKCIFFARMEIFCVMACMSQETLACMYVYGWWRKRNSPRETNRATSCIGVVPHTNTLLRYHKTLNDLA